MKMCSLQKVQCEFNYAGCGAEFIRDHQKEHMEQNTQKHLALMAAATLRISQTFEEKLQEKDSQTKKALEDQELRFEKRLKEFQIQHEQEIQQIRAIEEHHESDITSLRIKTGIPLYVLTFSRRGPGGAKLGFIDTSPLLTHPGGYKFRISLYPKGSSIGFETHVSIKVFALKGDFDDMLKFPARFTISLELLNQHRDQDHYRRDIHCKVTREILGTFSTAGHDWEFIPLTSLDWNKDKQIEYFKNGCFKFRVLKIVFN